ncbi:hypothetical protein Poli38472_000754 [Pythium oligandrum]|uniref:Fatty acid hydroxylase domain-containing protein n=1 Tax=Pythium oligandrum TaxID=41045 RepID=A0A8K1CCH9_PYTOL|nr:hypothetical protein Poli38472_000754 [Pythium oligandrum]|eukprot:TMW60712.1 hypothetical protein Poli38472_000754 [Pythium oligandrum]
MSLLGVYGAGLVRVVAMVKWFEWIGSRKSKIYGEKRMTLTAAERRSIYFRILWLVIPTECMSYYWALAVNRPAVLPISLSFSSSLVEYAAFIPQSLLFELVFDLFHYVMHWTCHQVSWLYQHVHKRHHKHLHPCALSTYEQDGIDLCLTNVLPFVFASKLAPVGSVFQLHLLFAYKTYVEVAGHSGLEIKGFSFPQMPLINLTGICLRVHDHDLHHTHPRYNFAKRFAFWDKLFHTFRAADTAKVAG